MPKSFHRAVIAFALLLAASRADALTYNLVASLDGPQETPPVITLGTGTLSGTYDDVTNALTWSGSFTGLTSGTTNAHFHGPAAVGVGPAAVREGMTAANGDTFPLGVTSGTFSGSATSATISESDEAELLAGLWYVNIHTTMNTGGEIRGQVYATAPEPPTLLMLGLGFLGLMVMGRRRS
jgi:hypothetical protein